LEEIKDWAVSRERYWGTPLPVWVCESCKKITIIGSIADLKAKTKKSGNKYFVMRHGGTEANIKDSISFKEQSGDKLTATGREQVAQNAIKISNEKIDLIITSPFTRTRETAEIIKEKLGLKQNQIIFDAHLSEINVGNFDGKNWDEYHKHLVGTGKGWFGHKVANGESLLEVSHRTGEVIYELENKYKDKNILIVTHGGPAWLLFVNSGFYIPGDKPYEIPGSQAFVADFKRFKNAEVRELPFIPLPHNENYELDLHRPYIDEATLTCVHSSPSGQACGGNLIRTSEVMDVWLDSGCVPFAQDHYPFENKKWVEGPGYPADFISEGVDQTRGWFYTLHAVGILMGRGRAYKNVICLGLLMDAAGKKMSKSVGNVVDPWMMMEKYGVDTLRLWMYSVNQPGESKNFDEKTVALLHSQVFGLIYNVLAFYELYRDKNLEKNDGLKRPVSKNILDAWILTRMDELIEMMTKNLDNYKLLEPVRAIKDFVSDLSTWYLRRSRERFKSGEKDAHGHSHTGEAKQTLYFVTKTLAKVLAPFAPFAAEDIWQKLRNENDFESVHLEKWPSNLKVNNSILKNMQIARDICAAGNAERQKLDIPVRQPLRILFSKVNVGEEYQKIIKEELNVKEVEIDMYLENTVALDKNITEELKQEGDYRELVRTLQEMRKELDLTPSDTVSLIFETDIAGKKLIKRFEKDLRKTVLVSKIEFKDNDGEEIKINGLIFKVKIKK
jgi:isoleucyl-tRNA synthetase